MIYLKDYLEENNLKIIFDEYDLVSYECKNFKAIATKKSTKTKPGCFYHFQSFEQFISKLNYLFRTNETINVTEEYKQKLKFKYNIIKL